MQTGPKFLSQQWKFCLFISLPITHGVLSVLVELKLLSRFGAGEKWGGGARRGATPLGIVEQF